MYQLIWKFHNSLHLNNYGIFRQLIGMDVCFNVQNVRQTAYENFSGLASTPEEISRFRTYSSRIL